MKPRKIVWWPRVWRARYGLGIYIRWGRKLWLV